MARDDPDPMRSVCLVFRILGLVAVASCSTRAANDGGDAGANPGADASDTSVDTAPPTGHQSFVVTATITQQTDGGLGPLPLGSGHRFTMVVDWDTRIAIFGADGGSRTARLLVSGSTTTIDGSVSFGLGASSGVSYRSFKFTVHAGGTLSGDAHGQGYYTPPGTDVGNTTPVTATLTGVPDTEAPTLKANVTGSEVDPLSVVAVTASEPLPSDTQLTAVNLRGDRVELPSVDTSALSASLFSPFPSRMWRYGEQYTVQIDGAKDFAGNAAAGSAITFATTTTRPPLAAEDGFESAAGPMFAGARVLSGTGAPTISGARSLYIAPLPDAFPPGRGDMTQLALRIALAPSDTVMRFAYRSVKRSAGSIDMAPSFAVAAEGCEIRSVSLGPDSGSPETATIPGEGDVMLGPLMTAELALPSGAAAVGELTIVRRVAGCCVGLPAPPVPGLIIDDLRAE